MQIALDIPEPLYEKLKVVAGSDSTTVEQALVRLLESSFGYPVFENGPVVSLDGPHGMPRIHGSQPDATNLMTENLNDYMFP